MGRPRLLDEGLMRKLAKKLGKSDLVPINKMISKKAARLGISSEAALVVLAKEHGIGAAIYQRSLDAAKQAEIRMASTASPPRLLPRSVTNTNGREAPTGRQRLKAVIGYLITDADLNSRCADLLMAQDKFDRAINQATLVLEDRIRRRAQPSQRLVGESLVNFAFNEDLSRTSLQVMSGSADDQRGFTQMLRGVVPAFRNSTHHHIINFSREEAMRVCGFIDVLLRVVDTAVKVR
jgi:uncharacterized protein (TIGR02391 family)